MWPRLFNLLALLSLLFCILTGALWISTYGTHELHLRRGDPAQIAHFSYISRGFLTFSKVTGQRPLQLGSGQFIAYTQTLNQWSALGIHFQRHVIVKSVSSSAPPLPGNYGRVSMIRIPL